MLQQTGVDTAIPYFERFMKRFPTVESLSEAPLDDVLKHWAGLGYYSRARNLHRGAQMVVARGAFPENVKALREVPGIGPYVAGAIASIALGQDEPTVDGNIERVLSRIKTLSIKRNAFFDVKSLLISGRAGDFNQALMDLGATICTPANPSCESCPVSHHCLAWHAGTVSEFPPRKAKKKPKRVHMVAFVVRDGHRLLMVKRPASGLFGGLYDLPCGDIQKGEQAFQAAGRIAAERLSLSLSDAKVVGSVEHALTHRKLTLTVLLCDWEGTLRLKGFNGHVWATTEEAFSWNIDPRQKSPATVGLARLDDAV